MPRKKKNATGGPEPITRQWLDGLLERKLPGMLGTVGQNRGQLVVEFVKLVLLDRKMNPRKKQAKKVIWVDWLDQDANEERL